MTVPDLVAKLKASNHRADSIARIIGWVTLIQHVGWENLPGNRGTRFNIERTFRQLEIDPMKVDI